MKPIIKWAGGKRWAIPLLDSLMHGKHLIDPFLGGAAVPLHFADRFESMALNDLNAQLIATYRTVRALPNDVWNALQAIPANERTYYEVRARFPNPNNVSHAADFIYLNKCGFNGLYRVNSKGKFNAPWGKRTPVTMPTREELCLFSRTLANAQLSEIDFEMMIAGAKRGDLIIADPPYLDTFTSYTKSGFTLQDQRRLAKALQAAAKRGVRIIAFNSMKAASLYRWAKVVETSERRAINSNGAGRGGKSCLLITG